MKFSIVVPCYYNESNFPKTYDVIKKEVLDVCKDHEFELIFVDDGSGDLTLEKLKYIKITDDRVRIVKLTRNFGSFRAILAGMSVAKGDAVVVISADLQDPPEKIPEMLELWENGYEVIYAKRKSRKGESAFKLLTAKMFYATLNALSDVEIPKDTGDFRLVDRKVVDVVNQLPEHNKFLRGLFSWVGYKQIPFEYERQERFAGKTKYPLKKMLKLASDGIISFSTKPLKIVGCIGILSIIISIAILIYSLISYAFKLNNLTAGWTSIMVTVTFFAGIQLISIWIMSEYVGRIYDETKKRPEYIIDKKINC